MGYSYKGAISFGLIYIPIQLAKATRNNDISFHLLDKNTLSRVQYKKTCVDCNEKVIAQKDIVKAYPYEEGKYVLFPDEDFEKLKRPSDKNIQIDRFVDSKEVDMVYCNQSYFVQPTGGMRSFQLLKKAMEEEKKVGIAKVILGSKESLIMLWVKNGYMYVTTLYFQDELILPPYQESKETLDKKEVKLARAIIEQMTGPFDVDEYHDEYQQRIVQAIEQKIRGEEIIPAKAQMENPVSNLMDALEKSLNLVSKKPGSPTTATTTKKPRKPRSKPSDAPNIANA